MIREFFAGVGTLLRGFRMWRSHPKLMALGLIPAFIAWAVLLTALAPLVIWLGPLTDWMTPFADGWVEPWQTILRFGLGAVIVVAALALSALVFTALTLTIGDPFYQRIWKGVERSLGEEPTGDTGFWSTIGEGIRLVILGILVALLTLVIGFIPVIGGVVASVVGVLLSGRILARELTARAFDARGLTGYSRSELLGASRSRVLGFGVATQLCFLVPLGAIVTMPAAVAGSTLLAHDVLRRSPMDAAARASATHTAVPPFANADAAAAVSATHAAAPPPTDADAAAARRAIDTPSPETAPAPPPPPAHPRA